VKVELAVNRYFHFSGLLNATTKCYFDIIKTGKSLTGQYYTEKMRNPKNLEGNINAESKFFLVNKGTEQQQERFEGNFIANTKIEGKMIRANGQEYQFQAEEDYTQSIAMNVFDLKDTTYILDKKENPSASLWMIYLRTKDSISALTAQIQKIIDKPFFESDSISGTSTEKLNTAKKGYIQEYKKNEEGFDENNVMGQEFTWERTNIMSVKHNFNNILVTEIAFYDYLGGAHGNGSLSYQVFDLTSGKQITLDGIFQNSSKDKLNTMITDKIIKYFKEMSPNVDIQSDSGGYEATSNFYVNTAGIGFYYNTYELGGLGGYVTGAADIFIPFDEIKKMLKTDSPILRLLN
jgi:hypothetical protein